MIDYNNFAKTFAKSRKNMKWEEIDYFIEKYIQKEKEHISILDIGCGTGRLLKQLLNSHIASLIKKENSYIGIDLSSGLLEEAKKSFPNKQFLELNMLDIDSNILEKQKYSYIFFIASFHHLDNIENRKKVLEKAYKLLKKGGKIFMTNWALNSKINKEKYINSQIKDSKNNFSSIDYNIKIGNFYRYYHCFDLSELEFLAKNSGYKILENKLFENQKNFITILEK